MDFLLGRSVLWRFGHRQGRAGPEEQLPPHRGRHPWQVSLKFADLNKMFFFSSCCNRNLHFVNNLSFRILALIRSKKLPLKNLKHFVLDECDKMLEQLGESLPGA